jgi:two-component system, cell cycle response regulator
VSAEAVDHADRPKVLLAGDASARPSGLERALTRAGFQLIEREDNTPEPQADAVLITLPGVNGIPLPGLFLPSADASTAPVQIVLLSSSDPDGPAAALLQGASDALAAPIHLPELCARLHARIRERQNVAVAGEGSGTAAERNRAGGVPAMAVAEEVLDRRVQEEFERARRYSLSFSLVLLEVSELATLSHRLGTEAADRRRTEVGGVLRRELRLPDLVVPYGIDEFAIVLPETDQIGARQSVTRIRERLAGVVVDDGDPREARSRFGAGIVTYPHPAATQTEDLFALVEAALTRGKAQSGERIGVAL